MVLALDVICPACRALSSEQMKMACKDAVDGDVVLVGRDRIDVVALSMKSDLAQTSEKRSDHRDAMGDADDDIAVARCGLTPDDQIVADMDMQTRQTIIGHVRDEVERRAVCRRRSRPAQVDACFAMLGLSR